MTDFKDYYKPVPMTKLDCAEDVVRQLLGMGYRNAYRGRPRLDPDAGDMFTAGDVANLAGVSERTAARAIRNVCG